MLWGELFFKERKFVVPIDIMKSNLVTKRCEAAFVFPLSFLFFPTLSPNVMAIEIALLDITLFGGDY